MSAPKKRVSAKDQEVWRKYGVGGDAFADPHDYVTLDVFNGDNDGRRESFAEPPAAIQLLAKYGAKKPPMEEWFAAVKDPVKEDFSQWSQDRFGSTAPVSHTISVTADQMSESSDGEVDALSSDEMDVRQPSHPEWKLYKTAALATMSPGTFCSTADAPEIEMELLDQCSCRHRDDGWDAFMRRLAAEHCAEYSFEITDGRLRYYKLQHSALFVVLLLSKEQKSQLVNFFYLDVLE